MGRLLIVRAVVAVRALAGGGRKRPSRRTGGPKESSPRAWLTDVLGQIADIPQGRLPNYCRGIGSNRICERPPDRLICNRRGTRRALTRTAPDGTIMRGPSPPAAQPR